MTSTNDLSSNFSWALYDNESIDGAFTLDTSNGEPDKAVATSVTRPWLFGFEPTNNNANDRAVLILGGGGYVELMVGREGVQVARWLTSLGFHAFVLVHRFPTKATGAQAPIDDARQALRIIQEKGFGQNGIGLCGLSSGGHLAASLLSAYPTPWTEPSATTTISLPTIQFAIIGYAPISTNAKGRQVIPNKPALEPPEKQALYDTVQPDTQLQSPAPPTFIVYSGNDPVIPVVNAYRLAEEIGKAGGSVELHVFADAPHGFALDTVGLPVTEWPGMCERWLRQRGFVG